MRPRPNVDSMVLEFSLNKDLYKLNNQIFNILKDCLKNRRKSILNTLPIEKEQAIKILEELKIKSTIRIEELTISELVKIVDKINDNQK